jgi:hypothetical protein
LKSKKIAIVSDHAGYYLKDKIVAFLIREKYDIKDLGTNSDEPVDYPDYGHPLAKAVASGEFALGISICGTGNDTSPLTGTSSAQPRQRLPASSGRTCSPFARAAPLASFRGWL